MRWQNSQKASYGERTKKNIKIHPKTFKPNANIYLGVTSTRNREPTMQIEQKRMPKLFNKISEIQATSPPPVIECGDPCSCIDCDSPQPALLPVITAFPLLVKPQSLTEVSRLPSCGMWRCTVWYTGAKVSEAGIIKCRWAIQLTTEAQVPPQC
jgi:hypothetical protein